jgi:hypothetical protein
MKKLIEKLFGNTAVNKDRATQNDLTPRGFRTYGERSAYNETFEHIWKEGGLR